MAVPRKITNRVEAVNALSDYAAWRGALLTAEGRRRRGMLDALGASIEFLDSLDDGLPELPPRAPRMLPLGPVSADSPPVAYFGDRRVTVARPLQASTRPKWYVRDPLPVGANGVRVTKPGHALAAVVADISQLEAIRFACSSLAATCRAAGLLDRGVIWQAEADELGAFAIRHEQDTVPTLGAAWLAEWAALDATYPPPPAAPPVRRPVVAARLR